LLFLSAGHVHGKITRSNKKETGQSGFKKVKKRKLENSDKNVFHERELISKTLPE
jgi:hypothetical protein